VRNKPTTSYSGLTILLDRPSRFDRQYLISAYAGKIFERFISPLDRRSIDIQTLDTFREFYPETKVVMLLGKDSLALFKQGVTLQQQRGSPFKIGSKTFLASFPPQDCIDIKNYEDSYYENEIEEDCTKDSDEKSTKGATPRSEYAFWFERDCKKALRYLREDPKIIEFKKVINPPITDITRALLGLQGSELFLDIETADDFRLTCIGLGFDNVIYTIPISRYSPLEITLTSNLQDTANFLRALAVAMVRNLVVVHNAMFDLWVLAKYYKIPGGKNNFDTMIAHHRCYPGVRKSLGHCLSLYTDQPYHKNEGVFNPKTPAQERQLWEYNAKDIESLMILKPEILKRAKILGAERSIEIANRMIRPYLTMTLTGIELAENKLESEIASLQKEDVQTLRLIKLLAGSELNPNSPKQMREYLFDGLGYKAFKFSEKTKEASTGIETLLRLRIKHPENHVLGLCLKRRGIAKKLSMIESLYAKETT